MEFTNIDGEGGVPGRAGPCCIRSESSLPLLGFLQLDAADLVRMETLGTLDDPVLHEMGHIIGIGTIWRELGLPTGAGGSDPRCSGASAQEVVMRPRFRIDRRGNRTGIGS